MSNIVLVGLPGSGKTSLGKTLSAMLKTEFYDADEAISYVTGKTVKELIKTDGKKAYAEQEKKAVRAFSHLDDAIISVGALAVKDEENVSLLKENGILVFVERDLDKLVSDKFTAKQTEKMAQELLPLYEKHAHFAIDNNRTVFETAKNLLSRLGIGE